VSAYAPQRAILTGARDVEQAGPLAQAVELADMVRAGAQSSPPLETSAAVLALREAVRLNPCSPLFGGP